MYVFVATASSHDKKCDGVRAWREANMARAKHGRGADMSQARRGEAVDRGTLWGGGRRVSPLQAAIFLGMAHFRATRGSAKAVLRRAQGHPSPFGAICVVLACIVGMGGSAAA